jgi:hypothetical protein
LGHRSLAYSGRMLSGCQLGNNPNNAANIIQGLKPKRSARITASATNKSGSTLLRRRSKRTRCSGGHPFSGGQSYSRRAIAGFPDVNSACGLRSLGSGKPVFVDAIRSLRNAWARRKNPMHVPAIGVGPRPIQSAWLVDFHLNDHHVIEARRQAEVRIIRHRGCDGRMQTRRDA